MEANWPLARSSTALVLALWSDASKEQLVAASLDQEADSLPRRSSALTCARLTGAGVRVKLASFERTQPTAGTVISLKDKANCAEGLEMC